MKKWLFSVMLACCTLGLTVLPACPAAEPSAILYRSLHRSQEEIPSPSGHILVITVGDRRFKAELEDNASARALAEKLPLTVHMRELNGNEKYYDLPDPLPYNPERPRDIQAGDLMLYGSDCLVLFYESFVSSYAYTRLGRIARPEGLAEAVGSGDAEVTFQMQAGEGAFIVLPFR